ncbi:G-protein coupled receptor family C group 6 member A [Merluccius polli]|uniref:G-protein coupled receptor family C group 6 member A n=1 Tax=Merluccius polli TaxID=89951 RepID=A0AA47P1N4_MERPO|nr:G-protein coupled receptor family C group 6 member A [Merluccius polli]
MWHFLLCFRFLCLLCPLSATHQALHAYAPGNIIIGGLFAVHRERDRTVPSSQHVSCNNKMYNPGMFLASQMMIFAINEVNKHLPGVTLGYDIYETCGDVSLAMRRALEMSTDKSGPGCFVPQRKPPSAPDPRVQVVIGEAASELSIAVARILTLSSIAQISYASSSEVLSSKTKFPTFLRTVPSDVYQTKAIAELVKQFKWESVAIVGSDDEYGKYGSERLGDHFSAMSNVCLDFKCILPDNFDYNDNNTRTKLNKLMDTIQKSTAEAIILFTKTSNVMLVVKEAIRMKLNRTWIASDSWSTASSIQELPGIEVIGQVFGFTFKSQKNEGFKKYVNSMVNNMSSNPFWEYHLLRHPPCSNATQNATDCSRTGPNCTEMRCLEHGISWEKTFSVHMAVEVVAQALKILCDGKHCQQNTKFTAEELFNEIKIVNFTVDNKTYITFDEHGDSNLGYDIIKWQSNGFQHIGEYWPKEKKIHLPEPLVSKMSNITVTAFSCYRTCPPGHELKLNRSYCCKRCDRCVEGHISTGGEPCKKCENDKNSSPENDRCLNKTINYLRWKDPFIIGLCFFNILGIVITIFVVVIFVLNRGTPIVKAVGGYLAFLELFSLLVCFCLSFTFMLKPTKASCMSGMPLFGIAITLCVSCIMANLLQILVGFNFSQHIQGRIKRFNHPTAVVAIVFGVQLVLCSVWLAFYPPYPNTFLRNNKMFLTCDPGSTNLYLGMLGYLTLLAIVCFLFAFKGKRLPDLYKNASFVAIGMLLSLVVWIVFIPVYLQRSGRYTQVTEAAAVIITSYSMLCCHLVPKCGIMVWRKELNHEKAILDYIKDHYEQKGINVLQ